MSHDEDDRAPGGGDGDAGSGGSGSNGSNGGASEAGGSGPRYQYQRIEKMIRDRIERKEFLPGDRVDSEYQLADRLGVHRFTVNKAVGNLVREGLLYRVKGKGTFVSEKMQYETSGGKCVGVLFTNTMETLFTSWFYSQVLAGVRSGTSKDVLLFGASEHSKGGGPKLDDVSWDKVDGVILLEIFSREYLRAVAGRGVPFVIVDYEDQEMASDCIVMDNFDAGYVATRHLVELGHTRIAHVGEPEAGHLPPDPAWQDRRRGYEAALSEAGIAPEEKYFVPLPYRYASEKNEELNALLDLPDRPTAVYCVDDGLALLTIRLAEKRGIGVPGDLSVAGFGGSEASELSTPQLTTVRAAYHQMGRLAVERLAELIETGAEPGKRIVLPVELIVRGSTAGPPDG